MPVFGWVVVFSYASIYWVIAFSYASICWVVVFSYASICWVVVFCYVSICWVVVFSHIVIFSRYRLLICINLFFPVLSSSLTIMVRKAYGCNLSCYRKLKTWKSNSISLLKARCLKILLIIIFIYCFYVSYSTLLGCLLVFRTQPVPILEEEKSSGDEDDVPAWKKPKLWWHSLFRLSNRVMV